MSMPKNILIIDDEELVIESLSKLLRKEGYGVILAGNYKEALARLKDADFDLIVSDIRMPEIDGVEIIREIRRFLRENGKKSIPEILITGYSGEDYLKQAEELKVADLIYKPFDVRDFLQIVKNNLK